MTRHARCRLTRCRRTSRTRCASRSRKWPWSWALSAWEDIYVIEVNPRASRTVPFVSKCIGVSLAMIAARVMAGKTLKELGFTKEIIPNFYSAA